MTPEQIQQLRQQYGYNPETLNLSSQGGGGVQNDEVNKRLQIVFGGNQETKPEEGLLNTIGKGIISSERKFGEDIAGALSNVLPESMTGVGALKEANQARQDTIDTALKGLKQAKDTGKDTKKYLDILSQVSGTPITTVEDIYPALKKTGIQVAGDAAGVLLDIVTAGSLPGTSKALATEATKGFVPLVKEVAKGTAIGAGTGYGYDVTQNLQEGQTGLEAVQPGTATLVGGALGGAIPLASGVSSTIKASRQAKKEQALLDLVSPRLTPSVAAETKVTNPQGILGKISEVIPQRVKDVAETVKDIVNPKKTFSENKNLVQNAITEKAQGLISKLKEVETQVGKDRGFFTPNQFKSYMNEVKTQLADNPTLVGGDAEKTANKILDKFTSLVKEKGHTPSGLLEARKELDNWVKSFKGEKIFDPATENAMSSALRAIRQGGNDFLSKLVPDVNVKELLAEQSKMYDALDTISEKVVKGELRKAGEIGSNRITRALNKNPKKTQAAKYAGATIGGAVLGGGAYGALKGLSGN